MKGTNYNIKIMITVQNLSKQYKSLLKTGNLFKDIFQREYKTSIALQDISFHIEKGEFVGLIGPNGAGKTTTMKILSGILYPTSGHVEINGYNPFDKKKEYLKKIAFVMGQKNQLLWELPATDTFLLNKEIYEIPENNYNKNLSHLVELLHVSDILHKPVKTLSLGQRMRMELIAALIHNPEILFLDEPTIGLDIFAQETIISFLRKYQKETKATILLTSHYMQDVQRLAKRVIMIDRGNILYDGELQKLVDTYSQTKKISFLIQEDIDTKTLQIPSDIQIEYVFPRLTLTIKKDIVNELLPFLMQKLPYQDLTIENESLEDIIRKRFT